MLVPPSLNLSQVFQGGAFSLNMIYNLVIVVVKIDECTNTGHLLTRLVVEGQPVFVVKPRRLSCCYSNDGCQFP